MICKIQLLSIHHNCWRTDSLYIARTNYWLGFIWIKYWCLFLSPVYYLIQGKLSIIWDYSHVSARLFSCQCQSTWLFCHQHTPTGLTGVSVILWIKIVHHQVPYQGWQNSALWATLLGMIVCVRIWFHWNVWVASDVMWNILMFPIVLENSHLLIRKNLGNKIILSR